MTVHSYLCQCHLSTTLHELTIAILVKEGKGLLELSNLLFGKLICHGEIWFLCGISEVNFLYQIKKILLFVAGYLVTIPMRTVPRQGGIFVCLFIFQNRCGTMKGVAHSSSHVG